jgi:two-component system OmpR family response regulator
MAHILIVEDELHLAKGIKFNLEAEGYRVTAVSTGTRALEILSDERSVVDLVILDLMLPGMSGYAVCETMRREGIEIPVLVLSARTLTEDRTRGFEVGADQYLTKPFELDELLARVKGLIVRHSRRQASMVVRKPKQAEPPRRYRLGEAIVDFDTFEVVKGKRTRQMTPLEIRLLQYLIQSDGRIVSRQELLEKVWDQPGYLQTRAPDQFIRRLRKLFEPVPSDPRHFITVRDAGYRFIADPERAEERSTTEPGEIKQG